MQFMQFGSKKSRQTHVVTQDNPLLFPNKDVTLPE